MSKAPTQQETEAAFLATGLPKNHAMWAYFTNGVKDAVAGDDYRLDAHDAPEAHKAYKAGYELAKSAAAPPTVRVRVFDSSNGTCLVYADGKLVGWDDLGCLFTRTLDALGVGVDRDDLSNDVASDLRIRREAPETLSEFEVIRHRRCRTALQMKLAGLRSEAAAVEAALTALPPAPDGE